MTGKTFFLFPGQGAQYPGMALDILESSIKSGGEKVKRVFELASDVAGTDMAALLRDAEADALKKTDISQPTITLANLAAFSYLAEGGITPSGCAGFSLGEYAALACSGVITMEECFRLVTKRGKVMQSAIDKIDGEQAPGMAAVLGLPHEKIEALVAEWKSGGREDISDLYPANINSSRQTVVSGTAKALSAAESLFAGAGAKRFIRLAVAGPFHSPLMAAAEDEMRSFLENLTYNDPQIPLFSNVSGKQIFSGDEAKKLALTHITKAVRWADEVSAIAALGGIDTCLETGPGKVLQGLWRDSGSTIPCYPAGTAEDIQLILNPVNR